MVLARGWGTPWASLTSSDPQAIAAATAVGPDPAASAKGVLLPVSVFKLRSCPGRARTATRNLLMSKAACREWI